MNINKVKHVLFVTGMPKKEKSEVRAKRSNMQKRKVTQTNMKINFKKVERGLELRA